MQTPSSITYSDYATQYCIFTFTFGKNPMHSSDHINPARSASARLDLTFETGTRNPALSLLLYTETPQVLEITGKRNVVKDYLN